MSLLTWIRSLFRRSKPQHTVAPYKIEPPPMPRVPKPRDWPPAPPRPTPPLSTPRRENWAPPRPLPQSSIDDGFPTPGLLVAAAAALAASRAPAAPFESGGGGDFGGGGASGDWPTGDETQPPPTHHVTDWEPHAVSLVSSGGGEPIGSCGRSDYESEPAPAQEPPARSSND